MKKLLLLTVAVGAAVVALPAMASAATITFSRSTQVSGSLSSGGSATFTTISGAQITCTTHTIKALSTDLSSNGPTTGIPSNNTSLGIRAANNHYSTSPSIATSCTYTVPLLTGGFATVSVRCDWLLTAISTTTGDITLTADSCIVITFSNGALINCIITIGRQSITAGLSLLSNGGGATTVNIIATNTPVAYTTNRMCAGDTGANPARLNENILVRTIGVSNP